jgi:hypothetical protein
MNKLAFVILFLFLLFFLWTFVVYHQKKDLDEYAQCMIDLRKSIQSYKNLYKALYDKDVTDDELKKLLTGL